MCTVMNLVTLEKVYYTCKPKEAVIAAYAQESGDYNTWDYESRYSHLVEEGKAIWVVGNWSVFKDGKEF
jgi:hypothetical protein